MIYIDTSSLLKLVLTDVHSTAVEEAVGRENLIVVTPLAELESYVQLRGLFLGGSMNASRMQLARAKLARNLSLAPFALRPLPGSIFSAALRQHDSTELQCRTLDRIHLAAMADFGITRLMTHDLRQANAASELGYEVVSPGL